MDITHNAKSMRLVIECTITIVSGVQRLRGRGGACVSCLSSRARVGEKSVYEDKFFFGTRTMTLEGGSLKTREKQSPLLPHHRVALAPL